MPLFKRNFDKPGPGVQKDEPRKKGVKRFFELLFRDFFDLVKLNVLLCICVFPTVATFTLGVLGLYPGIAIVVSLLLAYPVGGAVVAFMYYITKMMRDDPSYVWFDFKRKFLENCRQAAPTGMVCTAFVYLQVYTQIMLWGSLIRGDPEFDIVLLFVAFISMLVFWMITPYIFLHFAYIDLKPLKVIKNSMLMSFAYIHRSFMGALMGGAMWVAMVLNFPESTLFIPLIFFIGVSLSMLLNLMWVWPPFDSYFKIEETLIKRMKGEGEGETEEKGKIETKE